MKHITKIIIIVAALVSSAAASPRVISLDYCSDQYVLKLADKEQIIAVSRGADKDYSYMRDEAKNHKRIRPSPEEVLILEPDLVIRQWGGGVGATETLSQFGAKVVSLGYPEDFGGVKANIRMVASALDQVDRGEQLIDEMQSRLDAVKSNTTDQKRALYVTPGGVTAGAHTMIDAILTAAGLINIAAADGEIYWPPLPAESLLLNPPAVIVTGFFLSRDQDINYWSAARHPAIEQQFEKTPTIHLPPDVISCAAWFAVDAVEQIAQQREAK
ncbi:ABC transporter substrate-binding protein [Hyphococcus flavus]|uniref:ABC transporter substrate-binding protein n=1 Tax=Hyphococcus flavus TaxID=1866326 RepID=A0AAF0CFF4_9PROT|nr:ABC transporter substrate-binding protein [Hyphococcus flavus]WDI32426.1 ABC transporter substrate-binding protein [Hyphococcus flavus]